MENKVKNANVDSAYVLNKCRELYEENGASAVYDYCTSDSISDLIVYASCEGCNAETPSHIHDPASCLVCGSWKK